MRKASRYSRRAAQYAWTGACSRANVWRPRSDNIRTPFVQNSICRAGCAQRHFSGQTIHPNGIVMEQLALVSFAGPPGYGMQSFNPLLVRRGKSTDRPVAAKEDAIPTEAGERMVNVGTQILGTPASGIGVGHKS